jgi:hypothetical protein
MQTTTLTTDISPEIIEESRWTGICFPLSIYAQLWYLVLIFNLIGSGITCKMGFWECLWGVVLIVLTHCNCRQDHTPQRTSELPNVEKPIWTWVCMQSLLLMHCTWTASSKYKTSGGLRDGYIFKSNDHSPRALGFDSYHPQEDSQPSGTDDLGLQGHYKQMMLRPY